MPSIMRSISVCWLAVVFALFISSAHAEATREIQWEDLQPPEFEGVDKEARELEKALAAFSAEDQEAFRQIAWQRAIREDLSNGLTTEADLAPEELQLLTKNVGDAHPKAARLMERAKQLGERRRVLDKATNDRLDGQSIRLPGYVLPLEFEGTNVTEFLLVPYVGACIHVPPPPPNQIVYVTVSEAFESEGLFAPVWVTGTLSTDAGNHDMFLVDGQSSITTGYALDASSVEPYKE